MKYLSYSIALFVVLAMLATNANAQGASAAIAPSSIGANGIGGWRDPALNHNSLMQNKAGGEGTWKLIGPFKVAGSSYLFGEHLNGDVFSPEAKAFNIHISYNTYNQELEFYSSSNPTTPLVKEVGDLDSFIMKKNIANGLMSDTKFIYGKHLGSKEKQYYQEIIVGSYSIYKKYKSELVISNTNYVQSDLRVFDLQTEYYYMAPGKGLKKIKPNQPAFVKEFKDVKDISTVVSQEEFTMNPEEAMRKAIKYLNGN